jgi:alkylation response protein AidB-like acyl-CoA dehydrogenase
MQLPTPEQNELRAISHKVLVRNATSERIREVAGDYAGHDSALWEQIADLGWLAMTIPENHDGLGLGLAELAVLAEEFGYTLQPSPFLTHSLATWLATAARRFSPGCCRRWRLET